MVMVRPFRAVRANEKYADRVAALPYDTMDTEEAKNTVRNNPLSYLRIDRAEVDLKDDTDPASDEVYLKARENLDLFLREGYLVEDDDENIFIYREIMGDIVQIGLVACVFTDEARKNIIRKHEKTKPDKVLDRKKHIKYCKAHTGTIMLTYNDDSFIENLIKDEMQNPPLYDFITEDNVKHTVWKLEKSRAEKIVERFDKIDNLYIADGHHRSQAAQEFDVENTEAGEERKYYLAYIAPKKNLHVMDYNRVISDLNGLDKEELLEKIGRNFNIYEENTAFKPYRKFQYGMFLDNKWYRLEFKDEEILKDRLERLDVSVLHNYIIEPVFDIDVPQKDPRIDFVGGIRGIKEIENRVGRDMKIGFSLFPTSIDELIEIADLNEVMPAKSTWFEPKVRCGLFIHKISG